MVLQQGGMIAFDALQMFKCARQLRTQFIGLYRRRPRCYGNRAVKAPLEDAMLDGDKIQVTGFFTDGEFRELKLAGNVDLRAHILFIQITIIVGPLVIDLRQQGSIAWSGAARAMFGTARGCTCHQQHAAWPQQTDGIFQRIDPVAVMFQALRRYHDIKSRIRQAQLVTGANDVDIAADRDVQAQI